MSGQSNGAVPSEAMGNMKLENGSGDRNGSTPTPTSTPTATTPTPGGCSFEEQFKAFSKFGDNKSDGKHITLSQSDKWMKQAKVIDGKKITTTDTGIYFKKLKSLKVGIADYNKFLDELARTKKVELDEVKMKMANCGQPGHHGAGPVKTTSAVNRLTDTSKYTGTHKQRFDDSGKGKGMSGRKELADTSGYVSGYQNKDTFGKPN